MEKLYSRDFPGTKAYHTEADQSTRINYDVRADEFDIKTKLWLLLFDHTIISSGHMVESPITLSWLESDRTAVASLAADRAIVPSLRNDCDNLRDFAQKHARHIEEPWGQRALPKEYIESARSLDDLFDLAITWSPTAESARFRDSLARDLERDQSPLRKRLVGIPSKDIMKLSGKVRRTERLTRREFLKLSTTYCPKRRKILCQYADVFYHLSGAREKDAYPLLHPEEVRLCREQITDEVSQAAGLDNVGDLWQSILSTWRITAGMLRDIPLSVIRQIRNDQVGSRVRSTWARVLKNASSRLPVEQCVSDHMQACQVLASLFREEVKHQRSKYGSWKRYRRLVEVIAWAAGGLTTIVGMIIANPLLTTVGVSTGVLGILTGGPILDGVEQQMRGAEIVLLSAKLSQLLEEQ